jgi:cyclopropane fatty-acyl-phospholipid synthase-like methyltransferase
MENDLEYTSYDKVPYESEPFVQTHPDRLATLGRLFGLSPVPITQCRVLELGCAGGGNLIPMACQLPQSRFVGVDFSKRQVEMGRKVIQVLSLSNIRIGLANIMDVDQTWGVFDYIICHGVYSWVADDVQEKILSIAKENLAENGIAYVSYNTYPGWHMREMIRQWIFCVTAHFAKRFFATRICSLSATWEQRMFRVYWWHRRQLQSPSWWI